MALDRPIRLINTSPVTNQHLDERVRDLATRVLSWLPYEANDEQMMVVVGLANYLLQVEPEDSVFVLQGYAGTGKTSLTGAIVKALHEVGVPTVLLAPTGRAAHIFGEYAGQSAWTIHRKIYRQQSYDSDQYMLADNKMRDAVYIVDEASMVSNYGDALAFGSGHLLDDLIAYVRSGTRCRLVMMGDGAQLPPVGQTVSPALDADTLQGYGLMVYGTVLHQISRQAQQSGILHNATLLRQAMEAGVLDVPQLVLDGYDDIKAVDGGDLIEELSSCYDRDGMEQTVIITRSNKRATLFNMGVRNSILCREELLCAGDLLLVAKNNYYWAEAYKQLDFIANGDVCEVKRVWGDVEYRYGVHFADVTLCFPDHQHLEMDVKIMVDCLMSDNAALDSPTEQRLYQEVMAELEGNKQQRYKALKQHPYYNALQVKFAYAVTCHKAQGGQWRNVFIDMGGIPRDAMQQLAFYRWLYTALTRASHHVGLINWRTGNYDDD